MKKEPKHYKALYSRFILLVIFTLIIVEGMIAQCTDSNPALPCHINRHFEPTCYPTYRAGGDITDLKTSGLVNVSSVTIEGAADATIQSMTITSIQIFENPGCVSTGENYDAGSFPAFYGIKFENSKGAPTTVTISVDGAINIALLPVGTNITFIVNAKNAEGATIVSRRYVFEIKSASYIVGDTHITTVDGVKYDFQAVGEFVTLRADGGDNMEIQTRQTAYGVLGPATDSYTGINSCVSVNTAVAARVGNKRVTFQPDSINGHVDSTGMKLRIDGKLTQLGDNGIDLGGGGRISRSSAGGGTIQIDFPNGASLIVTPNWVPSFHQFYLNITINNTSATKGLSGVIPYNDTTPGVPRRRKSWLPALPDGSSVGPMPQDVHQRFVTLYQTFADAWRVTDATSLFDYSPGTSTATFTNKNWPVEGAQSCSVPDQLSKTPIDQATAEQLTIEIVDPKLKANALFDVMVTGEPLFAQTYLLTQKVQTSTTATSVNASKDTTKSGEAVTFTATVTRKFSTSPGQLNGTVEFTADGKNLGQVKLEANGQATFTTSSLEVGQHQVAARFIPDSGSTVFSSSSLDVTHTVIGGSGILSQWWFWVLLILVLLLLIFLLRKKKT